MMANSERDTPLVSGHQLFTVRVDAVDPPSVMRVTISLDGRSQWTFEQPGWRPLGFGSGASGAFLWSAREVITLPIDGKGTPVVCSVVDEDLLAVFNVHAGWVLVCETSLRHVVGGQEKVRLEFRDAVESCSWASQDHITVRMDDGSEHHLTLREEDLTD